jgi:4-amino-4-deoxy-L-arabinose transferase-like glycosyltransferase
MKYTQPLPFWFGCILALFTLTWFGTLDYRHLIPSDEGRYAEIAREMFVSGDWITPRYNDYKYFEKPPLQLWATATAYTLFGVGEWQARIWGALTSFLTILMVGLTAWKLFGKQSGINAGLILASAPIWVIAGHFNSLDSALSSFMGMALCSLLLAQRENISATAQRNWMLGCWALMALAVLSKGLIGIMLPGLVWLIYSLYTRDWPRWQRLHFGKGLALFFLICAPWFVLVSLQNPEFPYFFFIHEHLQRFSSTIHHRDAPIYYFIPIMFAGFLPWLAQLPAATRMTWQERKKTGFRPNTLILIWALSIFIFFSVSHSKLPGYILPILPALALLTGQALNRTQQTTWHWQVLMLSLLVLTGLFATSKISAMGDNISERIAFASYSTWVTSALFVMLVGTIFAWWSARNHAFISVTAFAMSFFLGTIIAGQGHETLGRAKSGIDLVQKVKPLLKGDDLFYSVRMLDHTVPFYLHHPMIMVESKDELAFGIQQEPEKFIPTLARFVQHWEHLPRAFALMSLETYTDLQKRGLTMHEVARDCKRIIVTKHPIQSIQH